MKRIRINASRSVLEAGLGVVRVGLLLTALGAGPSVVAQGASPVEPAVEKPTVMRINLLTGNPQGQKKFYTEVFGFRPTWEGHIGGAQYGEMIARAWNLDPGARLHGILMQAPHGATQIGLTYAVGQTFAPLPRAADKAPSAGDHYMILTVPDLDEVIAKLRPYNVKYNRPPAKMIDSSNNTVTYEMVIYDPEGTLLIVVERKP